MVTLPFDFFTFAFPEGLRQELPLVLFDEHLLAGPELLDVLLLEQPQVTVDSIRLINSIFLDQSRG